jgi:hypothetical protein
MFPVPSSIPEAVDLYYTTRQRRLDLQKKTDELDEIEKALKSYLIEALNSEESMGMAGKIARVEIKEKEKPTITDWHQTMKWIAETESWDCIQRKLSDRAIKDRWEEGEEIPGVGKIVVKELSLHRVGAK